MNKYKMFIAALAAVLSGNASAQSVGVQQDNDLIPGGTANLAVRLSAEQAAAAAQFDIKLPDGITGSISSGALTQGFTLDQVSLGGGVTRVFVYNTNKGKFSAASGDVLTIPVTVSAEAESGEYAGGTISNIKVANADATSAGTFEDVEFSVNVGYDVLGHLVTDPSEAISVLDIQKLARLIVNIDATDSEMLKRGDMNKDNTLNVNDLVQLIQKVFPTTGNSVAAAPIADGQNLLNAKGGTAITLNLQNVAKYEAFQFDVTLPEGLEIGDVELGARTSGMDMLSNKIGDNTWRVLVAGMDGTAINGNAGDLLKVAVVGNGAGEATVSNIQFADVNANGTDFAVMKVSVQGGSATGINTVNADTNADKTTYSIGGTIRKGLQRGVNVVRDAAGKVTKVIKK